jgi:hypothetical protein
MDVVRKAFDQWKTIGLGLNFREVKAREDAEIRIGFMQGDGSWSYMGRDVLNQPINSRTMNFGWDIGVTDRHNGIDTALHEIGHTLGFPHEHMNPNSGIVWDEEAVYSALGSPPNNWSRETTYHNIIRKLSPGEINGSSWDPNSIMHYPFKPGLILKPEDYKLRGLYPAGGLSKTDIQYAKQFYPGVPTAKTIETLHSYEITVDNSEQQDFSFKANETRYHTIQTFGNLDTVLVIFEKLKEDELKYLSGDDNGGVDKNATLKLKLFRGKEYVIKLKVYYKNPHERTALMIW